MKITKIRNNKGLLTKSYSKQEDEQGGSTYKVNKAPKLWDGSFQVIDLHNGLTTLRDIINTLEHNEALTYSIPQIREGRIRTKGHEDIDIDKGIISRGKDFFDYPAEAGILFIDIDEDVEEEKAIEMLGNLYEPFQNTTYLYASSCSNGIGGKKGYHLYFPLDDMSDIRQAMNNLHLLSLIQGYDYSFIDKGCALRYRTFFDTAVYDRGRLDYISGPVCYGFPAPPRDIRIVEKKGKVLSLSPLLAEVDATEVKEEIRTKLKPEQDIVIKKRAKKEGVPEDEIRRALVHCKI